MNIEVEIRSFISKERYEELLEFFKKEGKFISEDYQETYYFDSKILNLTVLGQHKVFHVRQGRDQQGKFFITNDRKMTVQIFLKHWNARWRIEQHHRDLKQLFGLGKLFVQKKRSIQGVISLSYLTKNLLALLLREQGLSMTTYSLESMIEKEFKQRELDLVQQAENLDLFLK